MRSNLLLYSLVGRGEENDLGVRALRHALHGLKVADLHGGRRAQDVGGLAHELGGLDLGAGGDDFGFAGALALGRHAQRVLEVLGEDEVPDQHAFDFHAPPFGRLFDHLADVLGDFFAPLDHVLQHACADDLPERGLCAFHERLLDVANAEGDCVGACDFVVDDLKGRGWLVAAGPSRYGERGNKRWRAQL